MADDKREMVAMLFEKTASVASSRIATAGSPEAAAALTIGAAIGSVVAAIIRALGVEDAGKLIAELEEKRDEGIITDAHVARDNREIADAVSDLYSDDDDEEKPKRKRSSSRRKPKKATE